MNFGAFKRGLSASYMKNDKAEKELQKSGYKLDKELSGERAKVYTDANGQPTIAYRGTQNFHDVMTDFAIPLGLAQHTKRVAHSKTLAKKVEEKYGQPANAVGHSLGGYLAENSGAHGNIATFNKASVGSKNKNSKQVDVRTKRDLVSMFTPKKKSNITIASRSQNPLTEHTTDSLGRANEERVLFP